MDRKKRILISLAAMVLLVCAGLVSYWSAYKTWHSSIALGCQVEEYTEDANYGYLTIRLTPEDTIGPIRVESEHLRETLSTMDLKKIIGVHLFMDVPYKYFKEKHIDPEDLDPIALLVQNREFDGYCRIVNISTK